MSRNSITPSRAFFTIGVRVLISGGSPFGPGRQSRTAQAQLACGLGEPDDLDQAHAAIAGDRQALVIAEARNFRAAGLAGLQQRVFRRHVDLVAVDDELGHRRAPCMVPPRTSLLDGEGRSLHEGPYSAATRTGSGCGLALYSSIRRSIS